MTGARTVPDARRTALRGLIDDAGLFPPARKPLGLAATDHASALAGPAAWMIGGFVCPAGSLGELRRLPLGVPRTAVVLSADDARWIGSSIAELDLVLTSQCLDEVVAIEVRGPGEPRSADIRRLVEAVGETAEACGPLDLWLEIPATGGDAIARWVELIAEQNADNVTVGAKFRCGGAAVPPAESLATLISSARELGVPIKLTAGLHHPLRTVDPVSGQAQFGFLNVLAATALADAIPPERVLEGEPAELTPAGLRWANQLCDDDSLDQARHIFRRFGSCSFEEPIRELRELGALPPGDE